MRLGERQKEMLAKICKTNGGGVYVDFSNEKLIRSLEKHELVQGKLNQDGWAVHWVPLNILGENLEFAQRLSIS